ncbi:MAG: hypothetical protein ACFFA6_08835 [Promethearchaeota archaeon]
MVQVLEKRELDKVIIIVPELEEKVEQKLEKKAKKEVKKKAAKLAKQAKYHQELICVKKLKNKLDAQMYRSRNIAF